MAFNFIISKKIYISYFILLVVKCHNSTFTGLISSHRGRSSGVVPHNGQ